MKPTIKNIDSGILTGKAMVIELVKSVALTAAAFGVFNFIFGA